MIKKTLKILLITLIIFMSFIYFLLDTKHGLKVGIALAEKVIPGKLNIQSYAGQLGNTFVLKNITYQIESTTIHAKQIRLIWHWWRFVSESKTPLALNLKHLQIKLPEQKKIILSNIAVNGDFSLTEQSHLLLLIKNTQFIASPTLTIHTPQINALITGNYNNYQLKTQFTTTAANLPLTQWNIQTKGSLNGLNRIHLLAKLLNGTLTLTGQFFWSPSINWQMNIVGKNLQPSETWQNIPGKINLQLSSKGKFIDLKPHITFNIDDISGTLMKHPIVAQGQINYQPGKLVVKKLSFISDENQIHANGYIAKTANLKIHANLPKLGQLLPDLSGQAELDAKITGSGNNPLIKADAFVNQIKINNLSIDNIKLQINGQALPPKPLELILSANNIENQGQVIKKIETTILRTKQVFNFHSFMNADKIKFELKAQAYKNNKQSQIGKINQLNLQYENKKVLFLKSPIQFVRDTDSITVKPNCIYSPYGHTCIQELHLKKDNEDLAGKIKLSANDFSYLNTLFPQIEKAKGLLNVNLQISGTTEKPIITGTSIFSGALNIPYLKINLNPIKINIEGKNNGELDYDASITSKTALKINGTTNLDDAFKTKLTINGNNFQIVNNAEANILASPDLTVNYDGDSLNVTGILDIPYAKITPIDFTSTTTLSNDVVFVGEEEKKPLNLTAKIDVNLGKKVTFDYAGLKAKLGGDMTIFENPGGDTTATGMLTVEKGQYKAYGQDLSIRQGKIIYTGGSITNPGLNIEATRQINVINTASSDNSSTSTASYSADKQVVGIRIQGSAEAPQLVLFSEPSGLSQSDILSYLVLGKASGSAASADAGTLVSALSYLNIGDHAESSIKNQLDNALGIDIGLNSEEQYDAEDGDVVNNTSVSLGKSISSKLSLNYSIGIVVPINILTITYKLTENISLKSNASSQGTGVDIFYHYSKD